MAINFKELKDNKNFRIIIGSIIVLLIIIIIWGIYRFLKKKSEEQPFFIKKPRRGDYIIDVKGSGWLDGVRETRKKKNPYQVINSEKIMAPKLGNGYSYSLWINVEDWNYNYGRPKHIFHKGDREAKSVNPGVWLYPDTNNIMIRIDTYGRKNNVNKTVSGKECQYWTSKYPHQSEYPVHKYPDKDLGDHNYCRNPDNKADGAWCYTVDKNTVSETCGIGDYNNPKSMSPYEKGTSFNVRDQCDIVDFPIQRWVHLCLVLHNRTLDVYINGKMKRSCTYEKPPIINKEDLHITDKGGFKGQLSEFKYYNRTLSPNEIYWIYRRGYRTFSLYDKIANLKPKIKFDVQVDAQSQSNYYD